MKYLLIIMLWQQPPFAVPTTYASLADCRKAGDDMIYMRAAWEQAEAEEFRRGRNVTVDGAVTTITGPYPVTHFHTYCVPAGGS